ncbi:SWIM zinc finger family protein [Salinigranum halophilum]|uniref:SWIM zinc finger family protein n=1 Tax=Salinigranum halophilum TaxID=2565931 RepID=UPI00115F46D9|nr:SWIM zinc finger family protein [Salinigranum halophilum]
MSDHNPTVHPLARLDFSGRVRKRAQYEAFEFSLVPDGVQVRNESYADPENHEYIVAVRAGVPVACTCPADARFDGACKHRVAVAMRRQILDVVTQVNVVADGGYASVVSGQSARSREEATSESSSTEADDCGVCAELDSLPCWACFQRFGENGL